MDKQTKVSGGLKSRGQQTFSVKGQRVNILDFGGHVIFDAATQLCFERAKAATDNWSTNILVKLDKNRLWVVICGALVVQGLVRDLDLCPLPDDLMTVYQHVGPQVFGLGHLLWFSVPFL